MIHYLKQYESELIDKELVRQNQVPYMVGWVRHFLFLGNPDDAVFADSLEREGRHDWQIRQALEAVKLFRSNFPCCMEEPIGFDLLPLDQMRNRLKIKHYATSTEKSYLQWCSRYLGYCGKEQTLK